MFILNFQGCKLNEISKEINKDVYLKDESKQLTNSFKIRGVYYVITPFSLKNGTLI